MAVPLLPPVTIRPLASLDEYRAAVALQFDTWGPGLADPTSSTILKIGQKIGGVSAGAFAPDGTLLGFVFGLTGVQNGRLVHWSHMLAVRADARNLGIGRRLKAFQHDAVSRLGVREIVWTYDPLVARNAHLNFNVFGVRVTEYVRDMYGDMGSELNRGIGTDRFVVAWPVDPDELRARRADIAAAHEDPEFRAAPVINPDPAAEVHRSPAATGAPKLRVRIPADISVIQRDDLAVAARWRTCTRAAFEQILAAGYRAAGFIPDGGAGMAHYLFAL
jgi:chorismate synthase